MNCEIFITKQENPIDISSQSFKEKCFIFGYINSGQEFYIGRGIWRFELWGAASDLSTYIYQTHNRSLGAYVAGDITLKQKTKFYAFVGGKGGDNTPSPGTAGFNGGQIGGLDSDNGNCGAGGSGGGTDIRVYEDDLYSRIIVAGGGGSPGCYLEYSGRGGDGGTIKGNDGSPNIDNKNIGGEGGSFNNNYFFQGSRGGSSYEGAGSGGGGYFGGIGGKAGSTFGSGGGGGGSSYVSGCEGCQTIRSDQIVLGNVHYLGYKFTNIIMKAGNETFESISIGDISYTCHSSHGCIRISRINDFTEYSCKRNIFQCFYIFIFIMIYKC